MIENVAFSLQTKHIFCVMSSIQAFHIILVTWFRNLSSGSHLGPVDPKVFGCLKWEILCLAFIEFCSGQNVFKSIKSKFMQKILGVKKEL